MKLINLLLATCLLSICSCIKKDKDDEPLILADGDIGYAGEHSYMQSLNNDIISIADMAVASGSANLGSCVNVTHNTAQKKLTIDFGPYAPCEGIDGRRRQGKIIVGYTSSYNSDGSIHTFTFDKYNVDGTGVYGEFTVVYKQNNGNGQQYCTITGRDTMKLYWSSVPDDGRLIFLDMQLERTWTEGAATPAREDDVFEITGSMTIRNRRGVEYASTIRKPLKKSIACEWMMQGRIELGLPQMETRSVDYGNDGCDNKATLIIKNQDVSVDVSDF